MTYLTVGKVWRLEAFYMCKFQKHRFNIKQGFNFDLASIPRLFWWLIAPFELSILAPLLHDFLYHYHGKLPAGAVEPPREFTRKESDEIFRDLMSEESVKAWRRKLAYVAVRWFGGSAWKY